MDKKRRAAAKRWLFFKEVIIYLRFLRLILKVERLTYWLFKAVVVKALAKGRKEDRVSMAHEESPDIFALLKTCQSPNGFWTSLGSNPEDSETDMRVDVGARCHTWYKNIEKNASSNCQRNLLGVFIRQLNVLFDSPFRLAESQQAGCRGQCVSLKAGDRTWKVGQVSKRGL